MKFSKVLLSLALSVSISSGVYLNLSALESIDKIQGKDRYETAALIADRQEYKTVILVNSDKSLADGLSASGLSGIVNAPRPY
jgi:putative cell wall-binding protein